LIKQWSSGQLSNTLSEVINAITKFEDKHESECRSSEEMRAKVKEVNSKLKDEKDAARRLAEHNLGGEGRRSPNLIPEGGIGVNPEGREDESVPAWRLKSQRVVGSTDFKAYYPSLPVQQAARSVREMVEKSEVKIITDDKELGLFLASTLTREEVERLNLDEVVQERLHKAGAAPRSSG